MQLIVYALVFLGFVLAVVGLAIGVIMKRKPLAGSCGGLNNLDGNKGECSICGAKADDRCQDEAQNAN